MTDNSDLLGAIVPAAPVARRRGRPSKPAPQLNPPATAVDVAPPDAPIEPQEAPAAEAEQVPAGTEPRDIPQELLDAPPLLSTPEDDGSVSVTLPPISPEYAKALASRVQIVGQPKREYAWQRLKRAGRRL